MTISIDRLCKRFGTFTALDELTSLVASAANPQLPALLSGLEDDLGGVLKTSSPLLSRAFRGLQRNDPT